MESPYFNNLLDFVAQEERYRGELKAAMEEFQRFAGPIYETDRSYVARINSFHNWYILDRPMRSKGGRTPLRYFLEYNANTLPQAELARYAELEHNVHSVFELVRFYADATRLRDLVTGTKYDVQGTEHLRFMDRGLLFNTRLFKHGRDFYTSNYVLLHPQEVERQIKTEARKARRGRSDPKDFLFKLVLFQSRYDQYHQMDVHNIYRFAR